MPRHLPIALLVLACALPARRAAADDGRDLLHAYSVVTGLVFAAGQGEASAWHTDSAISPTAMGIRYTERRGYILRTLALVGLATFTAAKASGPKQVRTEEKTEQSLGQRTRTTTTTTTYYSREEKEAMAARSARLGVDLVDDPPEQIVDLQIYSRNLGGSTTGYRVNLYLFGFGDDLWRFETGFAFGHLRTATLQDGDGLLTDARHAGVPLRLSRATPLALFFAEFDTNFLGLGDAPAAVRTGRTLTAEVRSQPWRLGAAFTVLRRLYGEFTAVTPSLTSGRVGLHATVGLRF